MTVTHPKASAWMLFTLIVLAPMTVLGAGFFGAGLENHSHSGPADGGSVLQGTTLNNPIINTPTWQGPQTLTNPTFSGTVAGGATYTTPTLSSPVLNGAISGTAILAPANGGLGIGTVPSANQIPFGNGINYALKSDAAARTALGAAGRVANLSALKLIPLSTLTTGDLVATEGYYASGDGGGGLYWWDGASLVTDNGGTFISPTGGGTGRWRLIHTGMITVLQFGAKGDGVTNDQPSIQAAITYGAQNNQHIHLPGFISSGTEAVYLCTAQVAIPANRAFKLSMHGGHWKFSGLGAINGLAINSSMMTELDLQGEIVYDGTGNAVLVKPTNPVPVDALTAVIDSHFKINTIVNTNIVGSNANIQLDATLGSITNNRWEFLELNGQGAPGGAGITSFGIVISTPGIGFGVTDNLFYAPHVHHHNSASLQVGVATTQATTIARNGFWATLAPNGTKDGFNVFGVKNYGVINVLNTIGTPTTGIKWQSSATSNIILSTELAASAPISDQSTTKNNLVQWQTTRVQNGISVGASPFVYNNTSSRVETLVVSGGAVSNIEYSVDGSAYFASGFSTGTIVLQPGDFLRVTYSSVPGMIKFY